MKVEQQLLKCKDRANKGELSDRILLCTGGVHADKHSPQPHDLPLSPAHPASSGSTERAPQHRTDPARGRHGRQLRGKKKNKGIKLNRFENVCL